MRDEVECCPHCEQPMPVVYKRKLNVNMAYVLMKMAMLKAGAWVHVPTFANEICLPESVRNSREWAKLKHWGLLEEKPISKEDGNPHAGYWRVTRAGMFFACDRGTASRYVLVRNNEWQGFEGPQISMREALGNNFNYDELLRESRFF